MKKKSAKLKKQGGERLENFGSGTIFGLLSGANLRKTRAFLGGGGGLGLGLGLGGVDLLRCSERKSVWPRYHGSKISGGVCCAFHKHAQPRFQSSSGISDVTFPVKTREL